ncbi:hypothetical protein Tco_0278123 [Tanacetum coccineum]
MASRNSTNSDTFYNSFEFNDQDALGFDAAGAISWTKSSSSSIEQCFSRSGASINLLPHSIYKKLELELLTPIFTDELAPLDSLPSGNDDSTLKKEFHEVNFQVYSNPLFEFDESFRSSNVNPLFEEKDKDVEIKSSSSSTLTSPEASELEDYLEKDSIPPDIDFFNPSLPPIEF